MARNIENGTLFRDPDKSDEKQSPGYGNQRVTADIKERTGGEIMKNKRNAGQTILSSVNG